MLIKRLWRQQPGKYFCISTKTISGAWDDHFFKRNQFKEIDQFVLDHQNRDIYFCPHGFSKPRRLEEFAVLPKLLWSDLDEADPRTAKLKPTIAIQSSPGRYVGLWRLDETMSPALNRRLTYYLGGDKSGWDLTQVLRWPGTTNYKYPSRPKTRIMWADGDEWSVKQLERVIPKEEIEDAGEESDAAEVFKKYSKKFPMWLKRELSTRKPPEPGKRSEMIWKIANSLLEAGLGEDDAIALIKASVWNKFRGRRNEDEQLKREWDKAINHHFNAAKPVAGEDDDARPQTYLNVPLSDVEEVDMDWVWYPYLARGEVSILEGDPEAGKSYLTQMISARLANGEKLPCCDKTVPAVHGAIAYFDLENTADTVTKKRLRWNGYESKNQLRNFIQEEKPFSMDDDEAVEGVYEALERVKPVLIVFDTLNTYIGKANTSQGAEAQQTFVRFKEMAVRFNCAVLVLRHLTKGSRDKAMYRGQGNIALTGVARVQMLVGKHPDDDSIRVMIRSKGNLTRPPPALTYEIQDASTKEERDRSRLVFGGFVELDVEQIGSASLKAEKDNTMDEATKFLQRVLGEGEEDITKLLRMAEASAISRTTLNRAADKLKVVKTTQGYGKKRTSLWSLPE